MRITTILQAAAAALTLAPFPAFADDAPVHAGQWQITTHMSFAGFPEQAPMSHLQCLSSKEAAPKAPTTHHGTCEVLEQKVAGGKVTWKVRCQKGEGSGEVTYKGDAFDGVVKMSVQGPRGRGMIDVTQTMHGERVGDCPK